MSVCLELWQKHHYLLTKTYLYYHLQQRKNSIRSNWPISKGVHWCNCTVKKPIFFLQCEILVYKLLKQNSNKKEPENQDLEVKAELLKVHLKNEKRMSTMGFFFRRCYCVCHILKLLNEITFHKVFHKNKIDLRLFWPQPNYWNYIYKRGK